MGDMWDDMEPDDESEATESDTSTESTESTTSTNATESTQADKDTKATESPKVDESEDTDPYTTPGFSYSADIQRALYVLDTNWTTFENGLPADVEYQAKKHGLQDVRTSEIHNALIKVVNEDIEWERVLDALAEERGIDPDDLD